MNTWIQPLDITGLPTPTMINKMNPGSMTESVKDWATIYWVFRCLFITPSTLTSVRGKLDGNPLGLTWKSGQVDWAMLRIWDLYLIKITKEQVPRPQRHSGISMHWLRHPLAREVKKVECTLLRRTKSGQCTECWAEANNWGEEGHWNGECQI